MANEHISRKQSIGLGKEATSGTAVAVGSWIPKSAGVFTPKFTTQEDPAAHGVIDAVKDVETTKAMTEIEIQGEPRDVWFGHLLLAVLGLEYPCVKIPIPGSITGTFVEGETVTEATSGATATIRRLDVSGSSKAVYLEPVSGTLQGVKLLTGGTSGATATGGTIESPASVRHHVFRRKNDNTPVTYTIYDNSPIGDDRATYCALDSLDFEVVSGDWAKFTAKFLGKSLASTSAQTPSYTTENPFLAKHASLKLASAFSGLDAATAVAIERFKLSIQKNVQEYQSIGSTDVTSLHNQSFKVMGDFTLLYNANTQRDFLTNSTNQAMRIALVNTATIGSAANPTLQFDFPSCAFTEWSRTSENDGLVKQTLSFVAEFDVAMAMTVQALLVNTRVTAY